MRRRRIFLLVFVVLVLILIVGVAALVMMSGGGGLLQPEPTPVISEGPTPSPEVPAEPVVVVVQPVRRGMRIPPEAVEIRRVAVNELPDDPVYSLEDVVDKYATVDLTVRKPIRAAHVRTVVLEGADLALAIPEGKVLYAMPIRALSTVANAIRPGSYVDVLISFSIVDVDQDLQIKLPVLLEGGEDCLAGCQPVGEQIPSLVSQYTVQNVLVLGVGLWGEEKAGVQIYGPGEEAAPVVEVPVAEGEAEAEAAPPQEEAQPQTLTQVTVVTLAVTPQDALVLKWAWESNSSVDLALRSASDEESFAQPEAVTLRYMIDRFQITLPPKLPHVPENDFQYWLLEGTQEAPPAE